MFNNESKQKFKIQDVIFVVKGRIYKLLWVFNLKSSSRCFNEESCVTVPDAEGYVMVLQPEEPKISLSGIDHFARSAAEFESQEGVTLFPELRIVSTITREVEADTEAEAAEGADDDPTGIRNSNGHPLSWINLDIEFHRYNECTVACGVLMQ